MTTREVLRDDPFVKNLMLSSKRPDVEDLRPLVKEYRINTPQQLWDFVEVIQHLWAEARNVDDWHLV